MNRILAAAVLLVVVSMPAHASALWGGLQPGPHAVGFKSFPVRDYSRTIRPKVDFEGKPTGLERSQALIISVWYPARAATGQRMTFASYSHYERYDPVTMAPPDAHATREADRRQEEFFERPFNFPEGGKPTAVAWSRLRTTALLAVSEAPALSGTFPLLIGNNGPLTNSVTNEFLASHGFIVASAGPLGFPNTGALHQAEWSARNVEFTLAFMQTFPNIDRNRVGVMGFSGAGFGPTIAAMRNSDIDALAAIDSALYMRQFSAELIEHPAYGHGNLRIPFLHMFRAEASRTDEDLSEFRKLRYAERFRFLLDDPRYLHQDYSTLGSASRLLGIRGDFEPQSRRGFLEANLQLLRFFDAFVKRSSSDRTRLIRDDDVVTVEHLLAAKPAPDQMEARALFAKLGPEKAVQRLMAARAGDPEAPLFSDAGLGALGYSFINERNIPAANAVAQMISAQAPGTVYEHNMIGNIHMTEGRNAEAVAEFEKAVAALPKAIRMTDAEREGSRRNIQTKIDRLRGSS